MQEIAFGVVGGSGIAMSQPVTAASPLPVSITPSSASTAGVGSAQTGALVGTAVIKGSGGNLYGINVFSSAAGYLLIYDAATTPVDGAVPNSLREVIQVAANQAVDLEFSAPVKFVSGIAAVFSSTAPMLQTTGATAFIAARFA